MFFVIGVSPETSTWLSVRTLLTNIDAPFQPVVIGFHSQEWPAGPKFLRTKGGTGLLRVNVVTSTPDFRVIQNDVKPPPGISSIFRLNNLVDPYPEDLEGRTVKLNSNSGPLSFELEADAFADGQQFGVGEGFQVVEIDGFENMP
jgi:hypothetical protein